MKKILIQNAKTSRFTNLLFRLLKVEKEAWNAKGNSISASKGKIKKRIITFPEGVVIACEYNEGQVKYSTAGSQFCFRFNWDNDLDKLTSWDNLTNNGNTETVHIPNGNTGFLVGVGVIPKYRGKKMSHNLHWDGEFKVSELLIAYVLDILFDSGVTQVIANARIPFYHTMQEVGNPMSVVDYCSLRESDGRLYDPVLRFHERMGAKILKPVKYAMDDPESLNGGCWVIYHNRFKG